MQKLEAIAFKGAIARYNVGYGLWQMAYGNQVA
jgi:phage major head subunit gpT-like protein